MKAWFLSLTLRERYMVQLAGLVVLVFMVYLLIWNPISERYQKNKKNVASATETLKWMKSAAAEVNELRGGKLITERPQNKQFVLGLVDRTARKAGLGAVMKRVQPEGEAGVRVWFENAVFDDFVRWLALIEDKHGLFVNEINIEQTESTGLVNVRVFLDS